MPLAFQYGQPLEEFWHGDIRLLEARQKAYIRDVSFRAWKQAEYDRIAMEIGAKNAMATKKKERIDEWIEWKDPVPKKKKIITNDNLEETFREEQFNQNSWLHDMLNKK